MASGISFIIPCYNCADTVEASIRSIVDTNLAAGDEIILIDDASTDNTLEKLQEWARQYSYIKVYRHNINKGTAAAGRNTGIDHALHELIFCLDADNVLYPHSIKKLKQFLLENQLDAAAFGRIDYFKGNNLEVTHSWVLSEKLDFVEALNDPMKTPCGSGNYLYTKAIWKKAGRYNESLGGAYDSELFGLKLLAEGAKFWTLPDTAYLHRWGYDSTFIREYNRKNTSLLFLAALMDYWNQIAQEDVDYIFGSGRYNWMEKTRQRPLRRRKSQAQSFLHKKVYKIKKKLSALLEG